MNKHLVRFSSTWIPVLLGYFFGLPLSAMVTPVARRMAVKLVEKWPLLTRVKKI